MRRFIFHLAAFCLLQVPIMAAVVYWGSKPNNNGYVEALRDKKAMLQNVDEPRIILVGGSSVAFGNDCEMIRHKLGLHPINTGLSAHLGLHFILGMVEEDVRAGDVVLLQLEYALLTDLYDSIPYIKPLVAQQCPELGRFFLTPVNQRWQLKQALDHTALQETHIWIKRSYNRIKAYCRNAKDPTRVTGVYTRSSFNQYGDMIAHHGKTAAEISQQKPIERCDHSQLKKHLARIAQFVDTCQNRGATVFYSFPPMTARKYEQSKKNIEFIETNIAQTIHCRIILSPKELCFPLDHFYDTAYHLNEKGLKTRTERLIEGLAPHLQGIGKAKPSQAAENIARRPKKRKPQPQGSYP